MLLTPQRFVRVGLLVGLTWLAAAYARDWWTAERRFYRQLDETLWRLRQHSADRSPISPQERTRYVAQLRSPNDYERWDAAEKLASWGDTSAVPELVTAMLDDVGTRRTCAIAQSLGALGSREAVPALLGALNHPRNLDLRVCATHALADIGDERAVPVLVARARNRSRSEDDYVSAIIALGDLGLPEALPVLQEITGNDSDERLRSLAAASVRKIETLRASDPVAALLGALDDLPAWTSEEWVLHELAKRWDERVAAALNQYLLRNRAGAIRAAALLLHHHALRAATAEALAHSTNKQNQWLAAYARAGRDGVTLARSIP